MRKYGVPKLECIASKKKSHFRTYTIPQKNGDISESLTKAKSLSPCIMEFFGDEEYINCHLLIAKEFAVVHVISLSSL